MFFVVLYHKIYCASVSVYLLPIVTVSKNRETDEPIAEGTLLVYITEAVDSNIK